MDDSEFVNSSLSQNIRSNLCIIAVDNDSTASSNKFVWSDEAENFFKKIHKLGVTLTIVGPKPKLKFGNKKSLRVMDRHQVIGLKELEVSRTHPHELRILNRKTQAWSRLRVDACLVYGRYGVWPKFFDGWASAGLISLDACNRLMFEYDVLPGKNIVFVGTPNSVVRSAIEMLRKGAQSVTLVEEKATTDCWRAYRDTFIARGGRILLNHQVAKAQIDDHNAIQNIFLKNEKGTLILKTDTVVFSNLSDESLNSPEYWRKGLFYLRKRFSPADILAEEERIQDNFDWLELYFRVAKHFQLLEHKEIEGALKQIRSERKEHLQYRIKKEFEFEYSGKILESTSLEKLRKSVSVPKQLKENKTVASLECFEQLPCLACVKSCPENAIEKNKLTDIPKLIEDLCTGCGVCVSVCPPSAALLIQPNPQTAKIKYGFADPEHYRKVSPGSGVQLTNRKGDVLGAGKYLRTDNYEQGMHKVSWIEGSDIHLWEARSYKPLPLSAVEDPLFYEMASIEKKTAKQERGWITINNSRRNVQLHEPVTVMLTRIGQRRFEDALFCRDGSCGLCEIKIDGVLTKACASVVKEGMQVEISSSAASENTHINDSLKKESKVLNPLCFCKQLEAHAVFEQITEGIPLEIVKEHTGLGQGICRGKWCLHSQELAETQEKMRPNFPGFDLSPWKEVTAAEVFDHPDKKKT